MVAVAKELRYADVSALYTAVGEHHVSAHHVVQRLVALLGGVGGVEEELAERSTPSTIPTRSRHSGDSGVLVPGAPVRSRSSPSAARPSPATRSWAS